MPSYNYHCSKCDINFDKFLSFAEFDKLSKKKVVPCPVCKKQKSVSRLYDEVPHANIIRNNTVGALAEKNSKKLGRTRLEEEAGKKAEKAPKLPNKHWWGKMDKKKQRELFGGGKPNKEKIQKYIRTGE